MRVCLKPKPSDLLVIDVFVHVIILLAILFTFFVIIIGPLETKELGGQIKGQIDAHMSEFYDQINQQISTPESPDIFKKFIEKLNTTPESNSTLDVMKKYYSKPDQANVNWNKTPILGTIIVLIALIIGFVAIWMTLVISCKKCVPVGRIVLENIVLFGLIGGIEGLFFYFIAMHYVPVKPSFFVDETLKSMQKKFSDVG